jgi:hypothetical protein
MNSRHFAAIAALGAVSLMSAHADEADGSQHVLRFNSTISSAQVKAQARHAEKISNGGTGFIGVTQSGLSREQVRTAAIEAQRQGQLPRGEM